MKWNKVILSRDHSFILNSHQFLKAFYNVLGSVTSFLLVIIWFRTPSWKLALIEIVIAFVCVRTCILHACIYEFNIYFTITERSKLGIFQVEAGRREANVVRRDQDEALPNIKPPFAPLPAPKDLCNHDSKESHHAVRRQWTCCWYAYSELPRTEISTSPSQKR